MNDLLLEVTEVNRRVKFNQVPVGQLLGYQLWSQKRAENLNLNDEFLWSLEKLSSEKVHIKIVILFINFCTFFEHFKLFSSSFTATFCKIFVEGIKRGRGSSKNY